MSYPDFRPSGRRKAALGFIAITVAVDVMSFGIAFPVLPRLAQEMLGGDAAGAARAVGLLAAGWAIAQFIAAPILGVLSDRFGRRPVILISLFGLSLDFLIMALAPTIAWLFVGRILAGFTAGSHTAASAYVADITPEEGRVKAFGLLSSAAMTGAVIGPAIGGVLGAADPRLPFYVACGLAALNGVYGLLVLPESLPRELRAPLSWSRASPAGSFRFLLSHKGLLGLAGALFVVWLAIHAINHVAVLFTARQFGWGPMAVGVFLSVFAAANILVQSVLAPRVAKWIGERRTILLGLGLYAAGFSVMGVAPYGWIYWLGNVPPAIGNVCGPAIQSMLTRRVDPTEQGRLQGSLGGVLALAGLSAPLFTQVYAWAIGPGMPAVAAGTPILLGALLMVVALGLATAFARDYPQAGAGSGRPSS